MPIMSKTVDINTTQANLADLLSLVSAGSEVVLTNGDTPIASLAPVNLEPLRIARFEHAGVVYRLKLPVLIDVQYHDDHWVYHSPEINLWGNGETREGAWLDLNENFAYLWREIGQENDSLLDSKAIAVKRRLLELVETTSAGA